MLKLLNRFNLLKYVVGATLLAVPIYPKFPFIQVPGTYVSIRLEDFLLMGLGVLVAIYWLPRIKEFLEDNLNRKILIYLSCGLLATLTGIFLTQTVEPHIGILNWIRRIEYFIPFFAGLIVLKGEKKIDLEFFVKIIVFVVFLIFIYGVGQKYLSWPVIITQNSEYSKGVALRWVPGSHINSTFAGHYDLATFLVLIMPMLVVFAFTLKGKITRIVLFTSIFSGLWLLINAISRISIISYLMGVFLSLAILKKYREIAVVFIVSIIFFSLSSDLIMRYDRFFEAIKNKSQNILYSVQTEVYAQENTLPERRQNSEAGTPTPIPVIQDVSTSIRVNVEWPRALRALAKNPILGTGYSSITLATDSDYLRLLGETGILGFVSFLLIFLELGFIFYKTLPLISGNISLLEKGFLAGIIGALPGILVNAVFIDVFEASKFAILFWLLIGMTISLVKDTKNEEIIS